MEIELTVTKKTLGEKIAHLEKKQKRKIVKVLREATGLERQNVHQNILTKDILFLKVLHLQALESIGIYLENLLSDEPLTIVEK